MATYIAFAIVPFVLGFLFPKMKENKKQKNRYFIFCGIVMLLIMGCRHNSLGSVDTFHYFTRMDYAISCGSWQMFYEPGLYETGFQFLMYALSRIFTHPQWLLVITSLFFIISVFYFVNHNSDDIPLSLTLYVSLGMLTFHLQGMRQAVAMCVCLFAYEQAKRRHLVKFLLLVLLATTFHQTSIVFFAVYWLVKLKLNKRNTLLVSIISGLAVINSIPLVNIANTIFGESYSGVAASGGFVATAIYFITLLVCYFYYTTYKENEQSPLVFVMIIATAAYLIRYTGVMIAERISFYFMFSQIALIPLATKLFKPQARLIVRIGICTLAAGLFAYRLMDSGFAPYEFFW